MRSRMLSCFSCFVAIAASLGCARAVGESPRHSSPLHVNHVSTSAPNTLSAKGEGEFDLKGREATRELSLPKAPSVLVLGDSFVLAGFTQSLKPKFNAIGGHYKVQTEQSSYTVTWAQRMPMLMARENPDLVIVVLGANEIANTAPQDHADAVRRIAKATEGRACVWVSPPLWHKDTGIIDVIRQNCQPCLFFDSDRNVLQAIERQKDQIHPSMRGGAVWAGAFWEWLITKVALGTDS